MLPVGVGPPSSAVRGVLLVVAALAAVAPGRPLALDRFEIQVYDVDVDAPGQVGLEVHLNYAFTGATRPQYPGEIPPDRVGHLTLEPSVGVTDWLEAGAYLQFLMAPGGDARFAGAKIRAKLVVPEAAQERLGIPLLLGLNLEIAHVPQIAEPQPWAGELRPIVGWKDDRWLLLVNPIVGYGLAGPGRFRPEFEPCAKVAFDTLLGFAVGAEYYAGLGFIGDGLLPLHDQEHLLLGVVDLVDPARRRDAASGSPEHASPWEVNLALGGALTTATGQRLVAKAIVGRSF